MNYIVYKHTSPSGKSYIGITNDYNRRCREHRTDAKHHRNQACRAFHAAIRKYGWDAFTHEIIATDILTEAAAFEAEQHHIFSSNTMVPNGYNLTSGGNGNTIISEETREKLKGIRATKPAVIHTAETKALLSEIAKKRVEDNPEAVAEWVQARKEQNSKMWRITSPTGEVYEVKNLAAWCKERGIYPSCMRGVATGRVTNYKGWLCSLIQ